MAMEQAGGGMADGMDRWLDTLAAAADEVARGSLGGGGCRVLGTRAGFARFPAVAHIAIIAARPVEIGFGASEASCEQLARELLQFGADEAVEPPDVADALAELANMIAGVVKRRLAEARPDAPLAVVGLPLFVRAPVEPAPDLESVVADVVLGAEHAELFVLRRVVEEPEMLG